MDKVANEQRIIKLWAKVERDGIPELLDFLAESDFYGAPCSTKYHLAVPGGLAQHSLNVYTLLQEKVEHYEVMNGNSESVIICGLGHDLCKANFYTRAVKNVKENGRWHEKEVYVTADQLPLGHGEKSISILQDYIHLTDEEKLAIRWHMCAFDASIHFNYPNGFAYREAVKKSPLVTLLFTADFEASNIIEAEG